MKSLFTSFACASLFGLFAFATTGCTDEIDRITDCQDICSRYADCFDDSYDVEGCRNECKNEAADSENFDQRVDNCENCLDDRSCSSAAFGCATECAGIVP